MGGMLEASSGTATTSPAQEAYFQALQREADRALGAARKARKEGWDPTLDVEIVLAEDLAARVEAQTELPGVAKLVRDLTKRLKDRELVALEAARIIAKGEQWRFPNPAAAIDKAVRAGLSILTEGVLVAPLEGIAKVTLGRNPDGTDYVDLYFAGPIRAAGGTAQAMSVLLADVVRRDLNVGRYQPTPEEIERYKEEVPAYKQAQHLQYVPNASEIELIVKNCPVCINGEGTEKEEVSGHRDLARVETNQLRGGAVLVLAEGLTQKAPKVMKHVTKLGLEEWKFLEAFTKKKSSSGASDAFGEIESSDKFILELIAGRPVFAHPSRPGGFRLRYGRGRTCGIASTAISPVAMYAMDEFLAVGTQMKLERPGKGTICTPCAELEGPMVLLDDGELRRLDDLESFRAVKPRIRVVTDLGEILIPFGEFAENNAILPDAGFTIEWWGEILRAKIGDAADHLLVRTQPTFEEALAWSRQHAVPLHPVHTFLWHDVRVEQAEAFATRLRDQGRITPAGLTWPRNAADKEFLIALGLPHREHEGSFLVERFAATLLGSLGLDAADGGLLQRTPVPLEEVASARFPTVAWVARNLGVDVKPRAPTRIGARMGRPEKADLRKMDPPVHGLYPLGDAGGIQRDIPKTAEKRTITVETGRRKCPDCGREGHASRCICGAHTQDTGAPIDDRTVHIGEEYAAALRHLRLAKAPEKVKGVVGLTSKHKTPEPLEKAILRALHGVFPFKDGTIRFDLTDAPLTHFRPLEVGTPVAKLVDLGYTHDMHGRPLTDPQQLLELRVQDVIPSKSCGEYFVKVAKYIDDLLERHYGQEAYYRVTRPQELVGHLVAGLAPHTSGAVLGRIVGFTNSQVGWAHPFFHTGKRRNCLHPSTEVFALNSPVPERISLEALWDRTAGPATRQDDAGTLGKELPHLRIHAADPKTGRIEAKRVQRIYRIPSPQHLLRFETASGRAFTCSTGHRLETLSEGRIEKRPALEVRVGDSLMFAGQIALSPVDAGPVDLVHEFWAEAPAWVVLRGLGSWLPARIESLGGLRAAARAAGIQPKALDNFRRRDSLPLTVAKAWAERRGPRDVPMDARVAARHDTVVLPRLIPMGASFLRLLGYYLAEGHCRGLPGHWFQVSLAASEPAMATEIAQCAYDALGIRPRHNGTSLTLSGRVTHALFSKILKLGDGAHEKRISSRVASLPRALTRELLSAYFSGDGSVEDGRLHVTAHSVSKGLLRDIGLQLAARGITYRISTETRLAGGAVKTFLERKGRPLRSFTSHRISIRSAHAERFSKTIGFRLNRKQATLDAAAENLGASRLRRGPGDLIEDRVTAVESVKSDVPWLFDLEVDDHHNFLVNDLTLTSNCDGDEDALLLLMDAFVNFSKAFIPDRRGGLMDLPLVLSMRIDPREIDKEAHNLDVLSRYPLALYEAAEKHRPAKEVAKLMDLVEGRLGTPAMYEGFGFTLDTPSIQEAPRESSYKALGGMAEKMEKQLQLAEKVRAVDAGDVASRVLSTHLLPDVLGNLKAFAKQKVRCTKCNAKYRRVPLGGLCTKALAGPGKTCANPLTLTVPQAGVRKYLELCIRIADRYPVPDYTKERVKLARRFVDESFAPERYKSPSLSEFA